MDATAMRRFRMWYNQYLATHGVAPSQDLVSSYLQGEIEADKSQQTENARLALQQQQVQAQQDYYSYSMDRQREADEAAFWGQTGKLVQDIAFDGSDEIATDNTGTFKVSSGKDYIGNIFKGGALGLVGGPQGTLIGAGAGLLKTFIGDLWNNISDWWDQQSAPNTWGNAYTSNNDYGLNIDYGNENNYDYTSDYNIDYGSDPYGLTDYGNDQSVADSWGINVDYGSDYYGLTE